MSAYAQCENNIWYLRTLIGVFIMPDERTAIDIVAFMQSEYERGKRDKVLELREALYNYDEVYND
jgi:hypothetical protein